MDIDTFKKLRGIELYQWQNRALDNIKNKNRVLLEAPTSSGKTLIAEFMTMRALHLESPENVNFTIFVTPMIALVNEHIQTLNSWMKELGVYVTTSFTKAFDHKKSIIITTPERLFEQLTEFNENLFRLDLLILDEVHLVGDKFRGPAFELTASFLLMFAKEVIAMSATMGDVTKISQWIESDIIIREEFRKIKLQRNIVLTKSGQTQKEILDLINNFTGQTLVFRGQVGFTEKTSGFLVNKVILESYKERKLKEMISGEQKLVWTTKSDQRWIQAFEKGVPFHHAKLRRKQKTLTEQAFDRGLAKAIITTPTLMLGVNLPADQVIIADSRIGNTRINSIQIHQMSGRAGRPGKSKFNIAIVQLIATSEKTKEIYERLLVDQGNINSELDNNNTLLPLLRLIEIGYITNMQILHELKNKTIIRPINQTLKTDRIPSSLFSSIMEKSNQNHPLSQAIEKLQAVNSIRVDEQENITISEYGKICTSFKLEPDIAYNLKEAQLADKDIKSMDFIASLLNHIFIDIKPAERQKISVSKANELLLETGESFNPEEWTMREVGVVGLWALTQGKSIDELSDYLDVYPFSVESSVNRVSKWISALYKHPEMFNIPPSYLETLKLLPNQLRYGLTESEAIFSVIPDIKHQRAKVFARRFSSLEELVDTNIPFIADTLVNKRKLGTSLASQIRNNAEKIIFNGHTPLRCKNCHKAYDFVEIFEHKDPIGTFKCARCQHINPYAALIPENVEIVVDTCCLINQLFSKFQSLKISFLATYYISGWVLAELRNLEKKKDNKEQAKKGFRELVILENNLPSNRIIMEDEKSIRDLHDEKSGNPNFVDQELLDITGKKKAIFISQDENTIRSAQLQKVPCIFINRNTFQ